MSKELIVKHNKLIESAYTMTATEAKIVAKLTSLIEKDDEDFKEHIFKSADLLKELGLGSENYTALEQSIDRLMSRIIEIKLDTKNKKGENDILKITFVSSCIYSHSTSEIILRYDPNLKPYFLQLSQNFTKYFLKNILELKSFYAIRIYELLKQYEKLKERKIEIKELRDILQIKETEYKKYSHFKDKILKTAEREINEKTDLKVSFEEVKTGRKITAIKFNIEKRTEEYIQEVEIVKSKNKVENPVEYSDDVLNLFDLLPDFERVESRKKEIAELLKEHTFNYLKSDIEYCNEQRPEKYWSYFVKSVNSGHFSAVEIEKAEKVKEQKKEKEQREIKENERQEMEKEQINELAEQVYNALTEEMMEEYTDKSGYEKLPVKFRKNFNLKDMIMVLIKKEIEEEMKEATA